MVLLYTFTYATHKHIFRDARYSSAETMKLQKNLTILFAVQVIPLTRLITILQITLPTLLLIFPMLAFFVLIAVSSKLSLSYKFLKDYVYNAVKLTYYAYYMVNPLATLLIIKPYKVFLSAFVDKLLKMYKNKSVNNSVVKKLFQ